MWDILDTGVASAEENMRLDKELLDSLSSRRRPLLHFYDWRGESATYGHFLKPAEYLDLKQVEAKGLKIAKRPTGGGIVFHIWDFAFSVLVPACDRAFSQNTLENYGFVHRKVLRAVEEFLEGEQGVEIIPDDKPALDVHCNRFCMAQPTKYDLLLKGRKVAGAAQRKCKEGFLHQGTIALMMPSQDYLQKVLLPGTRVLEAMQAHTFALLGEKATLQQLQAARNKIRLLLEKSFNEPDEA